MTLEMSVGIPKILGHIWIGNRPCPTKWMETWKSAHPGWTYKLYDNSFLRSYDFETRRQINEYLKRGQYAGVSDLMRLEILYAFGGFLPEADSICRKNTDTLFPEPRAYTVYENEMVRGKLVSPILACEPRNTFVRALIDEIKTVPPSQLDEPWISTGNLFVAKMIERLNPDITIFPSYYFIPIHFTGVVYNGLEQIYAKQMFGTTRNAYSKPSLISRISTYFARWKEKSYNKYQLTRIREVKYSEFDEMF